MLKLNNVYKIYENGTLAVRNASLEFPGYGLVAIIGSSGCGKSTLLNLLSNNDIPSKGELLYNDIPYNKVDKDILNKDFVIIYQDFKLIENLSVYQNIMLSHELSNKDIDKDFVLSVADKLGITEILDEKVYSLSGGQQQRVAIARAVVRRPKVIFADEPTGNLDSENTNKVYEILKELSKEILVVIVSHDKAISHYADRMIEMQNGKVIGDYKGDFANIIEREKTEREVFDTEIDYIPKKTKKEPKGNKKSSKIGSKSIFSYTKGKNKLRKNKGLSLNSTLGLTIAFNNKGIVKKITLSLICAVMIGFILLSTSMLFSTYEYTLYKILKNSEDKLLSLSVGKINDNGEEVAQFILNNCNKKAYKVYDKFGLAENYDLQKIEEELIPACYDSFVNGMGYDEIYIDNPEELGIKMLYGRAPVERNEIAISKTNFDYWLYFKDFKSISSGEIIHFKSKEDIIGKKNFNGTCFTIVGVFDDRNVCNNINLTREEIERYNRNNFLYSAIIRPESIATESKFFDNNIAMTSRYKFTTDMNSTDYDDYLNFMPINQAIFDYYNDNGILSKYKLKQDEIVIADKDFIEIMEMRGKPLKVGDNIKLYYVKTNTDSPHRIVTKEEYFTKTYKIVGIEKDIVRRGCVFISEEEYLRIYKPVLGYASFLLNGQDISVKNMRDISKNFDTFLRLNNLYNISGGDDEYISITNKYIALPTFILAVSILFILLSVILSDIIKMKNKEILILKSCGAKQIDILKVFSANVIAILFVQIIIGIICGIGLLSLVNYIFNYVLNGEIVYFDTFWVGAENILLTIAGIVFVAFMTIVYALQKFAGKNLRKLFQKHRK